MTRRQRRALDVVRVIRETRRRPDDGMMRRGRSKGDNWPTRRKRLRGCVM